MKDFDWQVKFDVVIVSMATETIEYNLKISVWLSLHKIRSLDFPIYLHTAYYKLVVFKQSRETNNIGEMNKCWWTNKAS